VLLATFSAAEAWAAPSTLASMGAIPATIAAHVGNTPMIRLTRLVPQELDVELYGKLEAFNPGGSVKDRVGVAMIEAAEAEGRIEPGRTTIVEATSGNTGIALAFCCAAKGYDLTIFLPQGMSREREALLRLYGARVEMVESLGGMNEAVDAARAMAADPDVFLPDQFSNPANPEAHRTGTGPEILRALDGRVDVFVAGVGTGGTITGVGHALKAQNPGALVVAVEPAASAVLNGGSPGPHRIQGIGAGFVPAVLDRQIVDEVLACPDDEAIRYAHLLAAREGVLAGMSCGAAVWAALEVAKRPDSRGKRIVTVLPDSGERYISAPFFAPNGN
jgi:cysteine synthase